MGMPVNAESMRSLTRRIANDNIQGVFEVRIYGEYLGAWAVDVKYVNAEERCFFRTEALAEMFMQRIIRQMELS